MTAFIVPASLQNIGKALEVAVDVNLGMVDRITHAGLGCEMNHHREPMPGKQRSHGCAIRKIGGHETELRILAQNVQPRALQRRVVIIIKIVQADDMTAFCQQLAGDMKADKARRPGDQYCLIRHHILLGVGLAHAAPPPSPLYPPHRGCRNTQLRGYCQIGIKTIPRRRSSARSAGVALFLTYSQTCSQTWLARARCAGFCFRPRKFWCPGRCFISRCARSTSLILPRASTLRGAWAGSASPSP